MYCIIADSLMFSNIELSPYVLNRNVLYRSRFRGIVKYWIVALWIKSNRIIADSVASTHIESCLIKQIVSYCIVPRCSRFRGTVKYRIVAVGMEYRYKVGLVVKSEEKNKINKKIKATHGYKLSFSLCFKTRFDSVTPHNFIKQQSKSVFKMKHT